MNTSSFNLFIFIFWAAFFQGTAAIAQNLDDYRVVWEEQSRNSAESMPCGGGDIGLNVWVEDGDLLFYLARSGTFDENNMFPKLGRVRLKLSPDPFTKEAAFRQELKLREGYVEICGKRDGHQVRIKVWADVFRPVVHVDIESNRPVTAEASYESWRTRDRELKGREKFGTSYKWADEKVICRKDQIRFREDGVLFFHRNGDTTIFDRTVRQQGLEGVKTELWNPLGHLTYGGFMTGTGMRPAGTSEGRYTGTDFTAWNLKSEAPARSHRLRVFLHTAREENPGKWIEGLEVLAGRGHGERDGTGSGSSGDDTGDPGFGSGEAFAATRAWWKQFWERSYIFIGPGAGREAWQAGRNYQLFRYMLGCNAFGSYPTKFNGGLFTFDPVWVGEEHAFSPDYRNWGGGTFTAQNQRLVYWPLLKSGDTDLMRPQFDFYLRGLKNAELRSRHYWGHEGACFTEQIENFALPNYAEYGLKRPEDFDPGVMHNAWLEYQWETVLEFCLMILESERYTEQDISAYLPLISSCLTFFDEHYQYLAARRGARKLNQQGHLVLYPSSAAETYKMAYNATPLVAGLRTVLEQLLALPSPYLTPERREAWQALLERVPPIPFREMQGHRTIAPAVAWERIQNTEIPQLYPVFPYGIYGVGKPDLEVAVNTWKYDTEAIANRNYISWHQDNIFCARLGLTEEAAAITLRKLGDSGRRFPAFWGPGHDWVPDHNWGGSGMIGLQEMLMQTPGDTILLFPAWPAEWDVHFKLHAPGNTTVEVIWKNGKLEKLDVRPLSRKKDVIDLFREEDR